MLDFSDLFGQPTNSPFGSSSAFGQNINPSNNQIGQTSAAMFSFLPVGGASSAHAFGSLMPAVGASSSSFGGSSLFGQNPASSPFGSSLQRSQSSLVSNLSPPAAFGASSAPAPAPSFSFWSSSECGQSTSACGSSLFGATTTAYKAQSSLFGGQTRTTPAFWSSGLGPVFGTRSTPYTKTPDAHSDGNWELVSISAMPAYNRKSHEELRWEDYQSGEKGSMINPAAAAQSSYGGMGFHMNNTQKTYPSLSSSPFGTNNPFGTTVSPPSSAFGSTNPATYTSIFGPPTSSPSGTSTSIFGTTQAQQQGTTTSLFGTGFPPSSPLFHSTTPPITSPLVQQPSLRISLQLVQPPQTTTGGFSFATPSGGFGNTSSSMGMNQKTPSISLTFQSAQPAQNNGGFGFGSTVQPAQNNGGFGSMVQPATPQMSISHAGNALSIQFGNSSLPAMPINIVIDGLFVSSINNFH